MRNSSVDGYIITATRGLKDEIMKLKKENIPFVLIDRLVPGLEANYVVVDNYRGAYDLTRHLLKKGYSQIGYISLSNGMSQMVDREKGFKDALAESKVSITAQMKLEVPFNESDETVITAIKKFIARNPGMDALFFATNYLGLSGIEALQRSELAIPSDIAVVCFDDNDLFRLLTPSITVAAQPIREIATRSIELLLKYIKNEKKQMKPEGEIIQPEIIIRNSTPQKKMMNVAR
jgi:LacI family transcriptional regulator